MLLDCIYGDKIINTIDNFQRGKLAGSLWNNTVIGTNLFDEITIKNNSKDKR
jgi:hypothetical protein